jgi:selenocysteine lyase/cysteine desulfurase
MPVLAGESGGARLRDRFNLSPDIRYFNAANIGPTFHSVLDAYTAEAHAFQVNPSMEFRMRYPLEAIALRKRLGARLNVTGEEIAILRNCSEGNTVAVRGLALRAGDEVVLSDHNHQSMLDSWRLRAERRGSCCAS